MLGNDYIYLFDRWPEFPRK